MFGRNKRDNSNFSEFIEQKSRLFHAKVVYAFNRDHEHYYSKQEVLNPNIDPRCKICGMLLSEYRTQKRFEQLNAPVSLD